MTRPLAEAQDETPMQKRLRDEFEQFCDIYTPRGDDGWLLRQRIWRLCETVEMIVASVGRESESGRVIAP